jgi:hypothetical protein
MSCETLSPLPLLEMVGGFGGRGFLAALMLPNGVEEGVMFAVAPVVDIDRGKGRSTERWEDEEASAKGLKGASGEEGVGEGKGLSKAASESISASGVDALEAIAIGGKSRGLRLAGY